MRDSIRRIPHGRKGVSPTFIRLKRFGKRFVRRYEPNMAGRFLSTLTRVSRQVMFPIE